MRRASSFHLRQSFMELKMTSLIDIVFQLLIFFVWTASFRIAEYVLPSQVSTQAVRGAGGPSHAPPPEADFSEVVVRVLWTNGRPQWLINDRPATGLPEVRQILSAIFTIKRDSPVIIHPDRSVPLGHVIDLYDLTRNIGFLRVQFAASPEK